MNLTHHVYLASNDRVSGTTSNFRINLAKSVFAKCISLSFAQFPNTYYNITSKNNAIKFGVTTYTVTPGIYTLVELINAIAALTENLTVTFDDVSQRITIANIAAFDLDLNISNSIYKKIGFAKAALTGADSYTGSAVPKLYENAVFITINNISSGCITSQNDFVQNCTFIVPNNTNKNEINQFYKHSQFNLQPYVNSVVNHFDVRIMDDDGYELENLGEWALMLELHN